MIVGIVVASVSVWWVVRLITSCPSVMALAFTLEHIGGLIWLGAVRVAGGLLLCGGWLVAVLCRYLGGGS